MVNLEKNTNLIEAEWDRALRDAEAEALLEEAVEDQDVLRGLYGNCLTCLLVAIHYYG